MQILNIPVAPATLERWRSLLAPPQQPFFLTAPEAAALGLAPETKGPQRCQILPLCCVARDWEERRRMLGALLTVD